MAHLAKKLVQQLKTAFSVSKFCFPEIRGNNSLFSAGPVIKCFVIPPNSKVEQNCEEIVCFTPVSSQIYRGFKEHDLITCESEVHVVVSLGSYSVLVAMGSY